MRNPEIEHQPVPDATSQAATATPKLPPMPDGVKPFRPPFLLRNQLVQTFLASLKFRKRGPNAMMDAGEDLILDCEGGVRLKGNYSPNPEKKAMVIFLHGFCLSSELSRPRR